ncbi:uncharacterized protein EI90DRAFT_1005539 [Cantharellus anzutake]|uniref:uncharacterized protein n=1 Tax=Cantharellus anzutake TaxID=1750568 RepID=UPI001905066F|nr:uncharacterized protein EI90DRAFT_1005539 [Cantharellus anzutake]KAF8331302.1 hypothetical protein EI90DRAFT_1005539 [Cantharellus anzutake]
MADVASRRRGGFTGGRGRASRPAPYSAGSKPSGSWKREVVGNPRGADMSSERLVITNLHYEVMPSDLKGIFESIGNLAREPTIKYDRSGRSTGTAWIHFVNPNDAALAKARLDGVSAKGQPMKIEIEAARPARDAPIGPKGPRGKLISRIGSLPLLDRMASNIPKLTRRLDRGDRPKGGSIRTNTTFRTPKTRDSPKTAEELDRELDAYLNDDDSGAKGATSTGRVASGEDVNMQ